MNTYPLILHWSNKQIIEEAQKIRVAYKLKTTLRFKSTRDISIHSESVAEHIYGMYFLSEYFLPIEDPEKKLDIRKIHSFILYHDFSEILYGDIPYFLKTEKDKVGEHKAALDVFASLPTSMQQTIREKWEEYEERKSPEALFVYAIDKIEPLFEVFDEINEQTIKRLGLTYKTHLEVKLRATEHYPTMRKFVEVLSEDMRSRGVFLE